MCFLIPGRDGSATSSGSEPGPRPFLNGQGADYASSREVQVTFTHMDLINTFI